jgi:DNA invertase Pin-like site-specific DNA recombinase
MKIGYIRVSTGKQNPDNQKDEIRRFAEEKSMTIDTWIEETVSGKVQYNKRHLGRVLKRMKTGDTLIVTEVSRLSRSLTEIMSIMGFCLEKGINIYTTKERYCFDNSINSKVLCFAFGLVAEIERNLISMRTKEALALRKSEGVRLGRRRGSDVKMEIIRENETEIERMLEEGMSVSMMCRKIGVARSTWYKYQEKKTVRSV